MNLPLPIILLVTGFTESDQKIFPISSVQVVPQEKAIQFLKRHLRDIDCMSERDSGKRVLEGVLTIGFPLYSLCRSRRVLFRGLLMICAKKFNKKF